MAKAATATATAAPAKAATTKAPAAPTVTLKQIAAVVAEKHDLTKKAVNELTDELVANIVKNLKKGNRIRMAGLGILQVKKRVRDILGTIFF